MSSLGFGTFRARSILAALVVALLWGHLSIAPRAQARWPWQSAPQAGTPQWWKEHKKDRVFDVEKGFSVEGEQGYFDGDGRPMQGPVAVERVIAAGDESGEETGLMPGLDPRVQYGKMKSAVGLGPNEQFARASYDEGIRLYNEKKYNAAADKFKAAISRGPHSPVEQDARFMLALSYYENDRYIKARDALDELVKEHPNTRYMDALIDREWKIARFWEEKARENYDWPLTPNAYDKTRPSCGMRKALLQRSGPVASWVSHTT